MEINYNQILIGQNEYGDLITADHKDGKITCLNTYVFIHRESTADDYHYITCWGFGGKETINGVEYDRGMEISKDIEPYFTNNDIKEIIMKGDFSEANGSFCSACGTFHDTEDNYHPTYVITEDCEVYCKDCVDTEDMLVKVNAPSDLFKAKNITDMAAPEGFIEIETLFCDSSGFGSSYERALTQEQAEAKTQELLDEHGTLYAGLTGIGQFQVYVTLYKQVNADQKSA